ARTSVWYTGGAYVCRSDDGGNTWQTTFTSPELSSVRILAADPRNAATAYGAFSDRYARPTIRKTVDGGLTWNPVGPVPTFADSGPTRILIDAGDPQTIYASFAGGVIRSRDGGQTWTPINGILAEQNEQGSSVSFEIAQDAARPQPSMRSPRRKRSIAPTIAARIGSRSWRFRGRRPLPRTMVACCSSTAAAAMDFSSRSIRRAPS